MGQPTNGGGVAREHAADGAGFSSMPAQFGALYQASYEAGYAQGREAGYRQGCVEGSREARSHARAKPEAASSATPGRRRGLLGLPCERCGTFLFSDEARCPRCQTKVSSGGAGVTARG